MSRIQVSRRDPPYVFFLLVLILQNRRYAAKSVSKTTVTAGAASKGDAFDESKNLFADINAGTSAKKTKPKSCA